MEVQVTLDDLFSETVYTVGVRAVNARPLTEGPNTSQWTSVTGRTNGNIY